MARIPQDEIDRLKREVSLQRLAEAAGVMLKRHGKDLIGLCPFHDDKDPSLVITPSKNLWNCLGACRTGGTPIEWVMRGQGVEFRHAIELLRAGDPPSLTPNPVKRSTVRLLDSPLDAEATDAELLAQVVAYYHSQLEQSPEALGYLERRGIRSSEAVTKFQLGFANRTLGYRLPDKNRREGEALRGRLQKLGILRDSGHEHFNGSLVFPVFDAAGQVVEMYGRKVTDGLRKGTPLHLYLPGPHHGVWNLEALAASTEIILCESLIDALTFWSHGFRNVTAAYGVNGFTDEHRQALVDHGTERVYLAYDRDPAGDAAAIELGQRLVGEGLTCYRVEFPRGLDANAYAQKVEPAAKALAALLGGAKWLGGSAEASRAPSKIAAKEEAKASSSLAATSPTSAAPTVATVTSTPAARVDGSELVLDLDDRRYRVRGLPDLLDFQHLKVNLVVLARHAVRAGLADGYVEKLDLYARSQRASYAREAALDLGVEPALIQRDLKQVLAAVEAEVEARRRAPTSLAPAANGPELSPDDEAAARELLADPQLLDRILGDFARSGVVGEETNKLVGYLASVSRKLEHPLAVIIRSSSAAGKSSLLDSILAFVPEEEREKYSAMTEQSLFYFQEKGLKHKVLAIVEEEGAERASYSLKLLQSEGELTIAAAGKNPETGKLETVPYRVEGPVMLLLTTTAAELDEELLNRCLVLTVDEDREQTRAIHQLQRENQTLEGVRARKARERLLRLHRNAQRLLRPLAVINPYARDLTFLDDRTRTRRDHMKYLTLIQTITLLHQYQRPVRTAAAADGAEPFDYIEVTLADIAVANRLAHEVLGRSLDELAPQTRRLLTRLEDLVEARAQESKLRRKEVRFSQREVREFTGWGQTQLKLHLARLTELEYLAVARSLRGGYRYELLHDGRGAADGPFLGGLLDVDELAERHGYDGERSGSEGVRSGQNGERSGSGRPLVGPWSGTGRTPQTAAKSKTMQEIPPPPVGDPQKDVVGGDASLVVS